jgi:Putative peptidoglycan binding domain
MTNLSKAVLGAIAAVAISASSALALVPAQTSCSYKFDMNLKMGARSAGVTDLQRVLNLDAVTQVAPSGVGSKGMETMYFGPATMAAVKKFQAANGISPVSGFVGPLTRAVLNTVCNGTTTGTTTTTTTTGTSVSSQSIPVGVLVAGQSAAKIADFVVSGNGTVTGLELTRTGVSNNDTLKNVYLYDGATRLTDASSVLTDGTIRFTNSAGLFAISGSKTLTVRADIQTNTSGQTVGVAMKSITFMGGTSTAVTAAGPTFQVATADVATVTFTGSNTANTATINAGTTNYNVWGTSLSVGTRAVNVRGLTLKQIGSAPINALSNIRLVVDGTQRATGSVNSNGMVVFDLNSSPVNLTTGSHTVEVRADVVAGANRNFYMSVENLADMMFEDSNIAGVFVSPVNYSTVKNGGPITVANGTFTISQDSSFTATRVVGGTSNATVAKFTVRAYGEDVKVQTVSVTPAMTGTILPASSVGLKDLALYVNGGQVGSTKASVATGTAQVFDLGSQFIVPAGQVVTLEVRANLTNSNNVAYTSGTIQVNLDAVTNGAIGVTSSQTVNTPAASGQSLTISSSAVNFGNTAGFNAQTVSPNTANVKIGSFTLQAQNTEAVRVTNIALALGGTTPLTSYSNVRITDGTTTIGQPTASNQFSVDYEVAAGTSKTIEVFADVNSVTNGQTIIPSMVVTFRGVQSNLTNTTSSVTGSTITVGTATVGTPTLVSSANPVSQFVVGNSTQQVSYNVVASGGTAVITELNFAATAGITKLTILPNQYVASSSDALVVGGNANFSGLNISVPNGGSGADIPVLITYNNVNSTGGTTGGTTANITLNSITARSGNTTTVTTPSVATNLMTLVASKPTITVPSVTNTGLNLAAENKIGEVTIAADAGGNIKVNTLTFALGSSGVTGSTYTAVRLADGSTTIGNATCTTAGVCTFSSGYTINANTSKTFSLFATNSGSATANVSVVSLSSTLSDISWNDVSGGGSAYTKTNIFNFPTNSYTIRQ